MSLSSFVQLKVVRAQFDGLRPNLPRKIPVPLRIMPRSNRFGLIGTAFDYLLRFELQRRAPHAISREWVAESAPELIYSERAESRSISCLNLYLDERREIRVMSRDELMAGVRCSDLQLAKEIATRATSAIDRAKLAVVEYCRCGQATEPEWKMLAAHAVCLAKLEMFYRSTRFDPTFERSEPQDVQELVEMLSIVPFESLVHNETMLLNPLFGDASLLVGGADADLVTGSTLVDFKVTKSQVMETRALDQLLGYFFLARRHRQVNARFPEIDRLGLYYCRHGFLWVQDSSIWTSHPAFAETEKWFFQRAAEVFASRNRGQSSLT
jgi:hypothetical protein